MPASEGAQDRPGRGEAAGLQTVSFDAMDAACSLAVTARGGDALLARRALDAGRAEVVSCERALSRFDPRSDLQHLNGAGGEWAAVGVRTMEALALALHARAATGGRFDPTILPALAAAGYDRSFERLDPRPARAVRDWRAGARIDLDPATGTARVGQGAAADLGGIGRGFAAARALAAMRGAWPKLRGARADLGGDMALWGAPPEGGRWRVAIPDPHMAGAVLGTLRISAGGVATSSRDRRRFGPGGRLHHLIDPATGVPAAGGPLAVTVIAPDALTAEAHATALAVTPPAEAAAYVARRPYLGAVLVPEAGELVVAGELDFTPVAGRADIA
jgi:FAD:protein FMN transferase